MSKRHKKDFTTLNFIEHCVVLPCVVTGYVSISDIATLVVLIL